MARLPFPELPPGALQDLMRELHDLHARAGWPGTRRIAEGHGFSHTAVHDLFTKTDSPPRLPLLLAVVEMLSSLAPRVDVEATLDRFDAMWVAAIAADNGREQRTAELGDLWYTRPRVQKRRSHISGAINLSRPSERPESFRLAAALTSMLDRCNLTEREACVKSVEISANAPMTEAGQRVVKPLGASELRQILAGERLPTATALRTILLVCEVPATRIDAYVDELAAILPRF